MFETIQLQAKDVFKAVKFVFFSCLLSFLSTWHLPTVVDSLNRAKRLAKSTESTPKFDEDSPELTPEQLEILEKAKEEALKGEEKRVRLLEKAYEKVRGEYVRAEEWLRNEYGELEGEGEGEDEDED